MSLMIEEQETHVNFMRGDTRAKIYTSDSTMMTKLNKLLAVKNTEWKLEYEERLERTGELIGRCYSCPKKFISFRTKRVERTLSEGQAREITECLKV